jgi:hypothetical protein
MGSEETRTSHGLLMTAAKDAVMPCQITVRVPDGQPRDIAAPNLVQDGRYVLLAPGWKSDVTRVNGAWEMGQHTLAPGRDPRAIDALSPTEKKQRDKDIVKKTKEIFGKRTGGRIAKDFLADRKKRDDREHER